MADTFTWGDLTTTTATNTTLYYNIDGSNCCTFISRWDAICPFCKGLIVHSVKEGPLECVCCKETMYAEGAKVYKYKWEEDL